MKLQNFKNFDRLRNRKFQSKRAQVTLFIIIGIVVLLSILLFLILKSNITRQTLAPGITRIVEELPTEFLPVNPFIENCIEKVTRDGLKIAGERGGYIYTDTLHPQVTVTEGDAVKFTKDSSLVIPYYFFLQSPNTCIGKCTFSSAKIPLTKASKSTENELSMYIEENIERCLDDFQVLKDQGYNIEIKDKPKAKVVIAKSDIVIELNYPFTLERSGAKIDLENHYAKIDLNLNTFYEMSEYITYLEDNYRFLEKAAINLLVGFSSVDKEMLPPMSDSTFLKFSNIEWKKNQVKANVKNILTSYIPFLRMANTPNWQEIRTGKYYSSRLYNYGMSVPNNSSINNLEVSFTYLDFWDPYFDLNCNGNICQPESGFIDILPIGFQRYNFAYDLSFPVLVEVKDPSAFNGVGYSWNFMLEANLRNNKPLPAIFNPAVSATEKDSLLCDENKRTSGTVTIETFNAQNNRKLDDVSVLYSCIDACYIGETVDGKLESELPVCLGGFISLQKEGFVTKDIWYSAELRKSDRIAAELESLNDVTLQVKKVVLVPRDDKWELAGTFELEEHDEVIVQLNGQLLEFKTGTTENIALAEEEYEITLNLLVNQKLFVQSDPDPINLTSFVGGSTTINHTIAGDTTLYVLETDILQIPVSDRTPEDTLPDFDSLNKKYFIHIVPE